MISVLRFLRPLAVISSGFFAGVIFNFIFVRFLIDNGDFCDYPSSISTDAAERSSDADYEPILVRKDELRATTKSAKLSLKFERPRFYADELEVKEKLLIAVISDNSASNFTPFAEAVNRTMANYVNKIAYMSLDQSRINSFLQNSNQSMTLVFSHPKTVNFFAQLTALFEKYAFEYDWLFLIDDATYVKTFRLLEFVSHLWSPNYDLVLGNIFRQNEAVCSLAAGGLLISASAASKIARRLSIDCKIDENLTDFPDGHFADCLRMENLRCSTNFKGKSLKSVQYSRDVFASKMANQALSVYDLPSNDAIYRLHKHFCASEMKHIEESILEIEQELKEKFLENPTFETPQYWPASVFPGPVPKNRFDILTWDFFTGDEIYEANKEIDLVRKLNAKEKRDIENALDAISKRNIGKNVELIEGYRRFDPNRGLDYIFNVNIREPSNQVSSVKRFRLVKPLTRAELSPAPFATETSTVHLILPIIVSNQSETTLTSTFDRLSSFLTNYESNNLAQPDETKIRLSILIGYFSENARLFFQPIGSRVEFLKRKFPLAKVNFLEAFVRNFRNPSLELIYSNLDLSNDELCLVINDRIQFDHEFLNRVRLNTLPNFQIFCPIPFVNFKVKNGSTSRAAKEYAKISKHSGRFDAQEFSVCSFYWSDFKYVWLQFMQINDSKFLRDVLDVFLQYCPKMKILRYAEPNLIADFAMKDCSAGKLDDQEFESCRYSNKANFASKKYYEPMIG